MFFSLPLIGHEDKIDYSKPKNLILTSVVMVIGLSGAHLQIGAIALQGMGLATVVAMFLGLCFALFDKLGWSNEE